MVWVGSEQAAVCNEPLRHGFQGRQKYAEGLSLYGRQGRRQHAVDICCMGSGQAGMFIPIVGSRQAAMLILLMGSRQAVTFIPLMGSRQAATFIPLMQRK